MKKLLYVITFFGILNFTFGMEFSGELHNIFSLEEMKEEKMMNQVKLSAYESNEDILGKITIEGNSATDKIIVYEGYVESYKKDFVLTLGKQRLTWGLGYLFNPANTYFALINPEDPKAEVEGINSMKLRCNIGELSRFEGVVFENKMKDKEIDYAIRYTTIFNEWEVMANYFKKDNNFILEAKGNLEIGIWGVLDSKDNNIVIGEDYSFEILDRVLYLMNENMYMQAEKKWIDYIRYSYQWDEELGFSQILTYYLDQKSYFVSSSINYIINDYMDVNFSYNNMDKKFQKISKSMLGEERSLKELKIEVSTYF
ncbi:MAG: hypothetical protein B6I28_01130 [Fusobacteriia bacterium 4572_132]|nr:MAG: hypothetical protein B6I28_01130 [Fusobacteriia bacterium 4572_132]